MSSRESKDYDQINRLAEEFAARFRKGERPALSDYVERYPHLADDIRELFPALVEMEQVESAVGQMPHGAPAEPPAHFERLGDFRILREVGRGGMGIVYEAEQLSLGRRVALKVLPRQVLLDARQQRRFEREAKAAARLHHTNIVPVFGVGEQDGLHYYVMQFIQGLGLDEVLTELRRMQSQRDPSTGGSPPPAELRVTRRRDVVAADVVRSMLDARFADTLVAVESGDEGGAPVLPENTTRVAEPGDAPTRLEPASLGPVPASTITGRLSDTYSMGGSSAALPGPRDGASGTRPGPQTYWQSVARIGDQVAGALQHAHDQGILHRDIKPSNLLLDLRGTVWVTDFGLAKANDQLDLTHTGDIMGTLRYMPPEAFDGTTDARSDVYSLGLTMYELAALRPAFDEKDRQRLIKLVTTSSPPRVESVRGDIPRDLATIIHKAIDRDPQHRYQSARELADDLERFIADEPIHARRVSLSERLVRWSRHNKALARVIGVACLLTVALVAGVIAGLIYYRQQSQERKNLADDISELAGRWQKTAEEAADARGRIERTLTDMSTERGLGAAERGQTSEAVLWFAHAAGLAGGDGPRVRANLARAAMYASRTPRPVRLFEHPVQWIESMSFDGTGRFLITSGRDNPRSEFDARVWDVDRGAAVEPPPHSGSVTAAAFNGDSSHLAVGTTSGEVLIVDRVNSRVVARVACAAPIVELAFVGQNGWIAVATGNLVRLQKINDPAAEGMVLEHGSRIVSITPSPDGSRLATVAANATLSVYSVPSETGEPALPQRSCTVSNRSAWEPQKAARPVFVDEGRTLLYARGAGVAELNLLDGRQRERLPGFQEPGAMGLISSASQQRYFALGYRSGRIQPRSEGAAALRSISHRSLQPIYDAAFTIDDSLLATAGGDRMVRFWSAATGEPARPVLEHPGSVSSVCMSPEGQRFATAGHGGLVIVWEHASPPAFLRSTPIAPGPTSGPASFAALTADGRYMVASGATFRGAGSVSTRVVETATGEPAGKSCAPGGILLDARFSHDGSRLATICSSVTSVDQRIAFPGRQTGTLHLWDWNLGTAIWEVATTSEPRSLDYSPDGERVAVLSADGVVQIFDAATGKPLGKWTAHAPFAENNWYINNGRLEFAPGGRRLVTWGVDNFVRVWNAGAGTLDYAIEHAGKTDSIAFSRDGERIASSCWGNNEVRVSEFATGKLLADPLPHPDWAFSVDFSPDGQLLVSACRDSTVRVWDWRAGRLALPPLEHNHEVHVARFSVDGRWIITGCDDGTARVWDTGDGRPVTPPIRLSGPGWSIALDSSGAYAIVGGSGGALDVLSLGELDAWDELAPAGVETFAELLACRRVEAGGDESLTSRQWLARYRSARAAIPEMFEIDRPAGSPGGRHQREADAAYAAGDWGRYFWHVGRMIAQRPRDVELIEERGEQHGRLGEWAQAADDLERVVTLAPERHLTILKLAHVVAELGDRERYRRVRRLLLDHFGSTNDVVIAERTAKACLILPEPFDEHDRAVVRRLAELSVNEGAGHEYVRYFRFARGLAAFREADYQLAADWMDRVLGTAGLSTNDPLAISARLVRAMSQFRLDGGEASRADLTHAVEALSTQSFLPSVDNPYENYWDGLLCRALAREGRALLDKPDAKE